MALAAAILGIVLDVAQGEQVHEVSIQAGALRRIVTDSLQFCFDLAAEGTPAHGAVLVVDEFPARVRCDACGIEVDLTTPPFVCARCGTSDVHLLSGTELLVSGVELESGWLVRRAPSDGPLMLAAADRPTEEHPQPDPTQAEARG